MTRLEKAVNALGTVATPTTGYIEEDVKKIIVRMFCPVEEQCLHQQGCLKCWNQEAEK